MSLRYAILGMLSKWDATGYDLKKEFDDVMSVLWHSHLSQIYPELNKLEEKSWVTSQQVPQEGKPDKKVYSITERGQEALMKWLMKPPEAPKVKDPFLLQTFFKDNIPVNEVILHLQIYKKHRETRLEKIKHLVQTRWEDIKQRDVMKPRILMSFAVLKRGLDSETQYIKWCDDTIKLLESCSFLWQAQEETKQAYSKQSQEVVQYTTRAPFKDVEEYLEDYLFS